MRNMLNQFYNFLSEKLVGFLKNEQLKGGERFFLQFDDEQSVYDFYSNLKGAAISEPFVYKHEHGSPYNTFCLNIEDIKLVVAATVNDVTPDFLVTLRNLVSDQEGQWQNTALLSISHLSLDSIKGGSKNLQNKGMPFHIKSITNYIIDELNFNDKLSSAEKEIIKFHLDKKLEDVVVQTSIWDYADIVALINKEQVEASDFKALGLFPDKELGKECYLKPSEINSRLQENNRLFEQVQRIHDYETLEELEKTFDEKITQKLRKEDWYDTEFAQVKASYTTGNRSLQYLSSETKKLNKEISFWEKPQLDTKLGQRKRHLIIFNEAKNSTIEMQFEFDDNLKKQFIDKKSAEYATTSGKKLKVTLPTQESISYYKVNYKHNKENQSNFEFNFCIVPFASEQLEGIESLFEVKLKGDEKGLALKYDDENTSIGIGEEFSHTITEPYETIKKEIHQKLLISVDPVAWDDDYITFTLQIGDTYLPIEFKDTDTKSYPIQAMRVWKLKRERREHFYLENNRLKQGTATYYPHDDFKRILNIEKEWVENKYIFLTAEQPAEKLPLPKEVEDAYYQYLDYFVRHNRLPSLSYMDEELVTLAKSYVESVISIISNISEHSLLSKEERNLFKLGTANKNGKIYLSSLHPLNVAYQLALEEELQDEELDYTILDRLHPRNLLPFLYSDKDELYRPTLDKKYQEWHEYEPEKLVSVGSANEFLATVVEDKINQFIFHFDYLFLESAQAPLLINVIQIHNDKEVVRGICHFLMKQLDAKGPNGMLPIEIALYRDTIQTPSAFEVFSTLLSPSEVETEFKLSIKSNEFDAVDVLRLIREHINYSKIDLNPSTEFRYSHISFFKLPTQDIDASHQVDKMESGIALDGIISSVVAIASESDYRSGFGLQNAPKQKNKLVTLAACFNELSFNMQNEGKNSYSKNKTIVMSTSTEGKTLLNKLYKASDWVTFIDPGVDLEFFQQSSSELLVIHYSDQYTTSDSYDAITVTDKSSQYKKVISDYIADKVKIDEKNIDLAIKSFNSINGEWLLSIIGSKGHFAREKISIIAAMKYLESYFYHPNITWIPISLEEILRVASATKLTKMDGIFSAKNLNSFGKHSDDILMLGVEQFEEELYLHVYPVEVKIGGLQTRKASIQIEKTTKLFKESLIDKPQEKSFKKKFFRNFFAQMLLSNAKKLYANGLWSDEKYNHLHSLKIRLMNDDFTIGHHLESIIGQGAVITFRKDYGFRSAKIENDILKLTFIEEDAYAGLAIEANEIQDKMQKGFMDFVPETLLFFVYQPGEDFVNHVYKEILNQNEPTEFPIEEQTHSPVESQIQQNEEVESLPNTNSHIDSSLLEMENTENDTNKSKIEEPASSTKGTTEENSKPLADIRVPIGTIDGSNQVFYWEFGNKELPNRHLTITGRSGQGKTYFIQCLLWELSKNGISSIIIDYTDGFKKSQLEQGFKEKLGSNLEQFVVLATKFPINPFKRNQKEIDEDIRIEEDDSDVADRIKNVIASIYPTLGIQQLNSIYQAVMKGMGQYNEEMNLFHLRELLEEDGSGPAKTAVSQLNLLIDKNPFDSNKNFDWSFLEREKGKVFIIQLTGYSPEVQKMITEFILWDLWYYKLHHGNKNLPFPVILDESQRLDFSSDSPSSRILVEGRKFGWSGWFSTQFLRGFLGESISRLQNAAVKVYFAPMENEISTIASNLTQDNSERKAWEARLMNLTKGQCIIYGPSMNRDGRLLSPMPYLVNILPLDER